MKRFTFILVLFVLLSLACGLGGLTGGGGRVATDTPLPSSEHRCGDNVCDGPEDERNCPQDCAAGGAIPGGGEDQREETPVEQTVSPTSAAGEPFLGWVFSDAQLTRTVGWGDCGIEPWWSEDCTAPKYWWGLQLEVVANAKVLVIPDGGNRWVITNHGDVVSEYGYDPADFQPSTYYRTATIDFGILTECSGTITGEDGFDFQVMGTREGDRFELILSANPQERIEGNCGVAGFGYDTTILLYGWAAALSGDPLDLSGVLTDADLTVEAGTYRHEFVVDTNPSPEDRDHVTATLEFACIEKETEGVYRPVACPWED